MVGNGFVLTALEGLGFPSHIDVHHVAPRDLVGRSLDPYHRRMRIVLVEPLVLRRPTEALVVHVDPYVAWFGMDPVPNQPDTLVAQHLEGFGIDWIVHVRSGRSLGSHLFSSAFGMRKVYKLFVVVLGGSVDLFVFLTSLQASQHPRCEEQGTAQQPIHEHHRRGWEQVVIHSPNGGVVIVVTRSPVGIGAAPTIVVIRTPAVVFVVLVIIRIPTVVVVFVVLVVIIRTPTVVVVVVVVIGGASPTVCVGVPVVVVVGLRDLVEKGSVYVCVAVAVVGTPAVPVVVVVVIVIGSLRRSPVIIVIVVAVAVVITGTSTTTTTGVVR